MERFDISKDDEADEAMEQADAPMSSIADTTMDKITDEAMEQADAVMETEREKKDRKNDKIKQIVATHLGEEVKYLPYIQQSTASSSTFNPNPPQPA